MVDFRKKLIAPCGINCGICLAYLREKNHCHGCREVQKNKPKTRVNCKLRLCQKRQGVFCFSCNEYPCERLEHLDKRYRTKYNMSEIDNLNMIKKEGINKFLDAQSTKYTCPHCGGTICVHSQKCSQCGKENNG